MTTALVDHLVSFKDTHITVASNILEDAERVASKYLQFMSATHLDIFNVYINQLTNSRKAN